MEVLLFVTESLQVSCRTSVLKSFDQDSQTADDHETWNVLLSLSPSVLDRINKQLAARQQQNNDSAATIRTHLTRLHSEMMDLRDALNDAVNNTARAAEINDANEKNLEDHQVGPEVQLNVKKKV